MATDVRGRSYLWETVKAVVVAIIISLLLLLLGALLIGLLNIDDKYSPLINQCIRGISILFACIFCLRLPNNRWIRGFFIGVLYVALAFFIFSAMNGKLEPGLSLLNDIAIGALTGLISGILAKLLRKDQY